MHYNASQRTFNEERRRHPMSTVIQNRSDSQERLELKTQDQRLVNLAIEGAGISSWEAGVLVDVVREVYFSEAKDRPLRAGQLRYECVAAREGAGKPLNQCQLMGVVLTLHDPEDLQIGYDQGHEGVRRHRIQRMTEEAREQGGLLSQEDLAQLLCCDVRTIRRDIRWLREKCEIVVATRGQQKDIGPGVTHRAIALRNWLRGQEPVEVARGIHHSLKAVERYIQHFSRVVFLWRKEFKPLQIAMTVGISAASVQTYLKIYQDYREKNYFRQRMEEIDLIGAMHYEAQDAEKGGPTRRANTGKSRRRP
jgi:hypothetical protein